MIPFGLPGGEICTVIERDPMNDSFGSSNSLGTIK